VEPDKDLARGLAADLPASGNREALKNAAGAAPKFHRMAPIIDQIRSRGGVDPDRIVDAVGQALRKEFGADPGQMALQAIIFSASRRE
jgi:hypothetical protein